MLIGLLSELKVLNKALSGLGEPHEIVALHKIFNVVFGIILTLLEISRKDGGEMLILGLKLG